MSDLYTAIREEVDRLIVRGKELAADGHFGFGDCWALVKDAARSLVIVAERFAGITGADKRKAVHDAIMRLYDEVIAPIDLPGPDAIIDPILRQVLNQSLGYVIDLLVEQFNVDGWPT